MARVVVDIASDSILQVEKTPEIGDSSPFNGRYALPVPDGADFNISPTSYILPQDGGDVATLLAAALLAQYPMYTNIFFNFLLDNTDVAELSLTATGPSGNSPRFQTGRSVGPAPLGQAPNTTALLPANDRVAPTRPGLIVTEITDIGPVTAGAGADEFLLWWHVWEMDTTEDVMSNFGGTAGLNTPAIRNLTETDQEPGDLEVFLSHDGGTTWTATGRLQPTDLVTFDTDVQLAFRWSGSSKLYLGAYAVMF